MTAHHLTDICLPATRPDTSLENVQMGAFWRIDEPKCWICREDVDVLRSGVVIGNIFPTFGVSYRGGEMAVGVDASDGKDVDNNNLSNLSFHFPSVNKSFDETLIKIADKNFRQLTSVSTGFVDKGLDFGSYSVNWFKIDGILVCTLYFKILYVR